MNNQVNKQTKAFLGDNPTLRPIFLEDSQQCTVQWNLIINKQQAVYILNTMCSEFKLSRIGVALKLFHHWSGVLLHEGSGQEDINVPFNE